MHAIREPLTNPMPVIRTALRRNATDAIASERKVTPCFRKTTTCFAAGSIRKCPSVPPAPCESTVPDPSTAKGAPVKE